MNLTPPQPLFAVLGGYTAFIACYTFFQRRKRASRRGTEAWVVGTNQPPPFSKAPSEWVLFDALNYESKWNRYKMLISAITPRPIALVSSISKSKVRNCAPFSYFNVLSHDPPMLSISVNTKGAGAQRIKKDTLCNIEETSDFVVNIISDWFVESANHTCGSFSDDIDEISVSGLTVLPSTYVEPERIAESAVQIECKVHSITEIFNDNQEHTTSVILAKIVCLHVHNSVLDHSSSTVKLSELKPIARAGGNTYTTIGETFDLERPRV